MTLPAWQTWQRAAATQWPALSPFIQWYFEQEVIALDPAQQQLPVWVAGNDDLRDCRLLNWDLAEQADGSRVALKLAEPLASNRSWINNDSLTFFQQRRVSLRGQWQRRDGEDRHFFVRVLWPQDFVFSQAQRAVIDDWTATIKSDQRQAQSNFALTRIWQQHDASPNDFVLGFVLNGAQGDDDEAHGGHFAVVLGQLHDDDPSDLLVANYYNPDVVSEKGILPAMTPLSNYLAELNSGQQYYRPSSLLCLRLRSADCLAPLYRALQQQMIAMYKHDWLYDHAFMNCTGISMDALRRIGFAAANSGNSAWLAPLAYGLTLLREHDAVRANRVMRYLCSERTRLFPAQAFLACVQRLLALLSAHRATQSEFEQQLMQQACALDYVRLPQFPSSRAWGRDPLFSLQDYRDRMPANRADWKIIPVQTRAFPDVWRPHKQS